MGISKSAADSFVNEYLQILSVLGNPEGSSETQNAKAQRYFSSGLISFIFSKERIDALFAANTQANALRIYYGAHTDGEPTLVLITCDLNATDKHINLLTPQFLTVEQHPEPRTSNRSGLTEGGFDLANDPIE